MGTGLYLSGLQATLGHTKANAGLAKTNESRDQVKMLLLFQSGPKKLDARGGGGIRKVKSPIQKKPQAHACKPGKENVGMGTSNLQKMNALAKITKMDIEEVEVGLKRKSRAPLEELLENVGTGKRPKVEEEVTVFGKLLATQMGSAAAAEQPCREQ